MVRCQRLESTSWSATSALSQCFFSWTNDGGTETHFRRIHYDTLDAFTSWRQLHIEGTNGLGVEASVADPVVSFRHCLEINGMFHAMENVKKRMLNHLKSWPTYKKVFGLNCSQRDHQSRSFISHASASKRLVQLAGASFNLST